MKISTAEIKMLIKKCVSKGGSYTVADLKNYITANSDKEMTRGQLSGAVFQLADAKEIIRVERGLYSKNAMSAFDEESMESQENSELKEELYKTLYRIIICLQVMYKKKVCFFGNVLPPIREIARQFFSINDILNLKKYIDKYRCYYRR